MATKPQPRIDEGNERTLPISSDPCAGENPLSSIFRLPHEVLGAVFVHCARNYHLGEKCRYRIWKAPDWVNVSYVCRHWRDVALHCPTLWTYHFVLSLRWTEELLARSKQASLKIRMMVGSVRGEESWWLILLELLMKHADRIQELHLVLCFGLIPEKLSKISICSRRLQSLKIVVPPDELESEPLDLPTVPVEGDTPALRKLKLRRCPVPWYSLPLGALTTLDLFHIPFEFQKNVAEFLVTLGSMQDLAHLYLDRAISGPSFHTEYFQVGSSFPRISLPRLTRLFAAASYSTIITLLSCLTIPPEAEIRLNCLRHAENDVREDYGRLSSLLAYRFQTSDDPASPHPTIRSVVIQPDHGDFDNDGTISELALSFSSSERDGSPGRPSEMPPWYDNEWDCKIPLKIFIDISAASGESSRIANSVLRPLPLDHVRSVHAVWFVISTDLWRETLGRLPRLQHIKLSYGGWPEIGSAFSIHGPHDLVENQGGGADQQSDQNQMYGQALEELELSHVDFWAEPTECSDWPARTEIQSLWDALSTRKIRCKLTMTQCQIHSDDGETELMDFAGWWEGAREFVMGSRPGDFDPVPIFFSDSDSEEGDLITVDSKIREFQRRIHSVLTGGSEYGNVNFIGKKSTEPAPIHSEFHGVVPLNFH